MTDVQLTHEIIGAAIDVHRELGPGLLELVYREALCHELSIRGLTLEKEKPIPAAYKGVRLDCGYRADIVVCGRVVVEIKAIPAIAPVHDAVMLTYLRLSGCRVGLLINFYTPALKDGVKRYVWGYGAKDTEVKHRDTEDTEKSAQQED